MRTLPFFSSAVFFALCGVVLALLPGRAQAQEFRQEGAYGAWSVLRNTGNGDLVARHDGDGVGLAGGCIGQPPNLGVLLIAPDGGFQDAEAVFAYVVDDGPAIVGLGEHGPQGLFIPMDQGAERVMRDLLGAQRKVFITDSRTGQPYSFPLNGLGASFSAILRACGFTPPPLSAPAVSAPSPADALAFPSSVISASPPPAAPAAPAVPDPFAAPEAAAPDTAPDPFAAPEAAAPDTAPEATAP